MEAAAAKPKPDIAAGTLHGIRAKCGGTVVRTNLTSGTMLVQPGQQVEAQNCGDIHWSGFIRCFRR